MKAVFTILMSAQVICAVLGILAPADYQKAEGAAAPAALVLDSPQRREVRLDEDGSANERKLAGSDEECSDEPTKSVKQADDLENQDNLELAILRAAKVLEKRKITAKRELGKKNFVKNSSSLDQKFMNDCLKATVTKIKIYNVGQGNGIGIFTDQALWIVDFGSAKGPTLLTKAETHTQGCSSPDNEIIADFNAEEVKKLPIIIMVTHPDADHYDRINNIFTASKPKTPKLKTVPAVVDRRRIASWVYSNPYDSGAFKGQRAALEALGCESKRFVVTPSFISNQYADEPEKRGIFFVNAPFLEAARTNDNSMMLKVVMENKDKYLLPGDATIFTYLEYLDQLSEHSKKQSYSSGDEDEDLGKPAKKQKKDIKSLVVSGIGSKISTPTLMEPEESMELDEMHVDEIGPEESAQRKVFDDIDYLVAPHHGARTASSHLLVDVLKPKKGVIFSASMYSQHHHPSFAAVVHAMSVLLQPPVNEEGKVVQDESGSPQRRLAYWDTNSELSLDQVSEKIKEKGLVYQVLTIYKQMPDIKSQITNLVEDEGEADIISDFLIKYIGTNPQFFLGFIYQPIFFTGIEGTITCQSSCAGSNVVDLDEEDLANKWKERLAVHLSVPNSPPKNVSVNFTINSNFVKFFAL